jgi:HlyD family secretion protein
VIPHIEETGPARAQADRARVQLLQRPWTGLLVFTLSGALVSGGGRLWGAPASEAGNIVYRVETGKVSERRLTRKLSIFGSLDAFQEVEISPTLQGQIVSMLVDEGDRVQQGQPLFELDNQADLIALERAKAELEKAEHQLRKLKAGSRPEEVEDVRKALSAAEAVTTAARDEWERVSQLVEQGVAAVSELVRVRADYDVSLAQLSQAKARLELVELGSRNEDILVAQAEMKVRSAQVRDIERRLEEHRISAPSDGTITSKLKEAGEWTDGGETVLILVVLNPMRLRIEVPQEYVAKIRPGLKAAVDIPGLEGEQFEANVRTVIPQAQVGSRNFPVLLRLENADLRLSAGMYARVELNVDEGRDVLTVPREAVQYRGQQLVVFRVDPPSLVDGEPASVAATEEHDTVARQIGVSITRELEREVVIETTGSGELRKGSEIVTMGGTRLKDGSLLRRLDEVH